MQGKFVGIDEASLGGLGLISELRTLGLNGAVSVIKTWPSVPGKNDMEAS